MGPSWYSGSEVAWVRVGSGSELTWVRVGSGSELAWVRVDVGPSWRGSELGWVRVDLTSVHVHVYMCLTCYRLELYACT